MSKKNIFVFFLFVLNFVSGQQNDEFKSVKQYFDYQRFMLNNEFKKRFDNGNNVSEKISIKSDFSHFMKKMDSVQNTALIGALIKVKNREDLSKLNFKNLPQINLEGSTKTEVSKEAKYPGGFEKLRSQVTDLFYSDAVYTEERQVKTNVVFVVEKDGSISSVHAEGENFTFNRQAEIAMYLLPEKFDPAFIDGTAVRYRFRLPLDINFEYP